MYRAPDDVEVEFDSPYFIESNNQGQFLILNAAGRMTIVDPASLDEKLLMNRDFWDNHLRPTIKKFRKDQKEARK